MKQRNGERIDVFVTKSGRFRAKIHPVGDHPFEITVGGNNWNNGHRLNPKRRVRICGKCARLLVKLREEMQTVMDNYPIPA